MGYHECLFWLFFKENGKNPILVGAYMHELLGVRACHLVGYFGFFYWSIG
jgi:hypothetical protein